MINHRIWNGSNGRCAELGHTPVVPVGGKPCRCGKSGCLETISSPMAIREDVLSIILFKQSPTSYIQRTRTIKKESDFRYQFAAQTAFLSRRIYKTCGVGLEELHQLETIYLICLGKTEIISRIHEEQRELLRKIQVAFDMC